MYFKVKAPDKGQNTLNGVKHLWPNLKVLGSKSLPTSRQALQGWRKLCPAKARLHSPGC